MNVQDMPNKIFQLWYWRGKKMGEKMKHDDTIASNRSMSFSFHWEDSPEGDQAWRDVHEDSSYYALETFHGFKVQQQVWREHDVSGANSLAGNEIYYVKTEDGHCHLVETSLDCNVNIGRIKAKYGMRDRLNFVAFPLAKVLKITSWAPASEEDKLWLRKCKAQDQTLDHPIIGRFRAKAYEDKVGVPSDAKPKLKVGDRVRVIRPYDPVKVGETGTVRKVEESSIGVEFDNYHERKHDLDKLCEQGYGWFLGSEHLEVISCEVEEPKSKPDPKFKVGDYVKVVDYGWGHAKEDVGRISKITEVKEDGENTNYKIDPPLNSNCTDDAHGTNHQNSYKLSTREVFEKDQIEHCGFKVGDRVEYIHEDYGVYGGSKYDLNGDTIGTVQDIMWSEAFDKVKIYVLFPNVSGKWACAPSEIKKKEIEIHDGHTMSTKRDTHKHTGGSEKYIVGSSIPKKDSWSEHVVRHAIDASKYGIKLDPIPYPWAEEPVIPKGSWMHLGADPYEDDTEFKLQTHKKLDIF